MTEMGTNQTPGISGLFFRRDATHSRFDVCANGGHSHRSFLHVGVDIGPSNPDWELVRRVAAGTGSWHPATDNLRGVNVYGGPDCETCDSTFSISWADVPFTYFLFATGDKKKWLVASKDAVIGRHYMDEQRDIVTSSDSPTPYQARWYNRNGVLDPEDPLVSIIDHHSAITADKIVYAEDSIDSHLSVLNNHNGANVYILPDSRTGGGAPVLIDSTRSVSAVSLRCVPL